VRSSLASEARLSFIIHPTRLTIAFYSNYSLVFLVTVARPDERENDFPFPDRPRAEVGTILDFLVGSFFIIYSKWVSSIRFISFRKNRSCGNARFLKALIKAMNILHLETNKKGIQIIVQYRLFLFSEGWNFPSNTCALYPSLLNKPTTHRWQNLHRVAGYVCRPFQGHSKQHVDKLL